MEKRLEWKENNYRTQFLKLQEAMDSLTGQQSMLSMMNASSLALKISGEDKS